jgi:hypothetical protein
VSLLAAPTRGGPPGRGRGFELQQLGQRFATGLMHGRADRHFHGFQIPKSGLAKLGEDDAQDLLYFARDFLMDGFRRFFSCGVSVPSTGRKAQIFSLTSTMSPHSF